MNLPARFTQMMDRAGAAPDKDWEFSRCEDKAFSIFIRLQDAASRGRHPPLAPQCTNERPFPSCSFWGTFFGALYSS